MSSERSRVATRVAAYIRVAGGEQHDDRLSYQGQEAALRAYCQGRALDLVEIVTDLGVGTHAHLANRHGGRRVLHLVRRGEIDAVLALRLDRLFHNSSEALTIAHQWRRAGVALLLTDVGGRPLDVRELDGEQFLATLAGTAEMDQHEIVQMSLASALQAARIPGHDPLELSGMVLAGAVTPSAPCWGDWWSCHALANDRTLVLVGDVTGHGVASAIVCSAVQAAVTTLLDLREGRVDLPLVFGAMDQAIRRAAGQRLFMSCFGTIYDARRGVISYSNAGHSFPYIYDPRGKRLRQMVLRGARLGGEGDGRYPIRETEVVPGTLLVWYTDGILQCENIEGEAYGGRRFRQMITTHAGLPPDELRDLIMSDAIQFVGEVPPRDDITLVVGRLR